MTDTPSPEWDRWQAAWRSEPSVGITTVAPGATTPPEATVAPAARALAEATASSDGPARPEATVSIRETALPAPGAATASPAERMRRRLIRARRMAWLVTAGDVGASAVFVGVGVYALVRSRALPVVVWAISLFLFTAVALGFAIWNRRDALLFSADSTRDFVAALQLRLTRRERIPRFVMGLLAAEIALGTAIHAVWYPGSLGRAARLYAVSVVVVAAWRWRYRERLRGERAQLAALSRELAGLTAEPGAA